MLDSEDKRYPADKVFDNLTENSDIYEKNRKLNLNADADTNVNADVDLNADADTEVDADVDLDANANVNADTDRNADADADANVDLGLKKNADTYARMNADKDADTEADADVDADADADADDDADSNVGAVVINEKVDVDVDIDAKVDVDVNFHTNADANMDSNAKVDADVATATDSNEGANVDLNKNEDQPSDADADANSKSIASAVNINAKVDLDVDIDAKVDVDVDFHTSADANMDTNAKVDADVDTATGSNAGANADSNEDEDQPSDEDSSENEVINPYEPTTTPESELALATSLGYPEGWRVIRTVPHPGVNEIGAVDLMGAVETYLRPHFPVSVTNMDLRRRIFTHRDIIRTSGKAGADVFYNHAAAMEKALDFIDGSYGGFGKGQELKEKPLYVKGEEVRVNFEGRWYAAVCTGYRRYDDEIRYSVIYKIDNAKQTGISKDLIMKPPIKSKKKPMLLSPIGSISKKKVSNKTKGRHTPQLSPPPTKFKSQFLSSLTKKELNQFAKAAKNHGFPQGWLVHAKKENRYKIWGPDGTSYGGKGVALKALRDMEEGDALLDEEKEEKEEEIKGESGDSNGNDSVKQVGESSDEEEIKPPPKKKRKKIPPKSAKKRVRDVPEENNKSPKNGNFVESPSKKKIKLAPSKSVARKQNSKKMTKKTNMTVVSNRDTPTISKKVKRVRPPRSMSNGSTLALSPPPAENDDDDPPWRTSGHSYIGRSVRLSYSDGGSGRKSKRKQIGMVAGWLAATDVDSLGKPAYVCEQTGEPRELFHVTFDPIEDDDILFVDLEEFELKGKFI